MLSESGTESGSFSPIVTKRLNIMDLYYGSGTDDVIIPKDHGLSDRIFSLESWSKWGTSDPESYQALEKCFVFDPEFTKEPSCNGRSLYDEVEMEDSIHDSNYSTSSSVCGGWSTLSCDYQFDGLEGFEQMDEIFLNSVLQDLPEVGIPGKSLCSKPRSGMTQPDNLLRDKSLGNHINSSSLDIVGIPTHQKAHTASPSVGSQGDFNASDFSACNSIQSYCLPMKTTVKGQIGDVVSLEETVLQELKMVTNQFTEKSRMCFRDSFYRLAKNSKQYDISGNQDGDYNMETIPLATGQTEMLSSGTKKATESESNTIDRAIASLMFNKIGMTKPPDNNFTQSSTHESSHHLIRPNDVEVPFFNSWEDLYATANLDASLSRNTAGSFVLDFGSSGG